MLPSRMLRTVAERQVEEDELADFATLLIDALQIPEVVVAINRALAGRTEPAAPPPRAAPVARGTARTRSRGGRRG